MSDLNNKGKRFESEIENLLSAVVRKFPARTSLLSQAQTILNDDRKKIIDFTFQYSTIATANEIGIECQDRERWDSSIIDKILAVRANSHHNRFWYVFRDDSFLSDKAIALLDSHGIIHFSLSQLQDHLEAIEKELAATQGAKSNYSSIKDSSKLVSVSNSRSLEDILSEHPTLNKIVKNKQNETK